MSKLGKEAMESRGEERGDGKERRGKGGIGEIEGREGRAVEGNGRVRE